VGEEMTAELTSAPFEPLGARRATEIGLIDAAFGETAEEFRVGVRRYAEQLASSPTRLAELAEKRRLRARDEQRRPLAAYRADELARSYECFFGADRSYHEARRRFVYKL
jgi:putative two-component system hydrogenase maturation factor HypX/HoxX